MLPFERGTEDPGRDTVFGPSRRESVTLEAHHALEATRRFHPVTHQPMETLHKQEKPKHNGEWNVEFVTEDGKGQQGLCNEHPCLVIEPL